MMNRPLELEGDHLVNPGMVAQADNVRADQAPVGNLGAQPPVNQGINNGMEGFPGGIDMQNFAPNQQAMGAEAMGMTGEEQPQQARRPNFVESLMGMGGQALGNVGNGIMNAIQPSQQSVDAVDAYNQQQAAANPNYAAPSQDFPGGIDPQLMRTSDVPGDAQQVRPPSQWENFVNHPAIRAIGRGARWAGGQLKNAWNGTGLAGMAAREGARWNALGGFGDAHGLGEHLLGAAKYLGKRIPLAAAEFGYNHMGEALKNREQYPRFNSMVDFVPGARTMLNAGKMIYPTANDYWQGEARANAAGAIGDAIGNNPIVRAALPGASQLIGPGARAVGRYWDVGRRALGAGANAVRGMYSNLSNRLRGGG
jgi:hypothetical protein